MGVVRYGKHDSNTGHLAVSHNGRPLCVWGIDCTLKIFENIGDIQGIAATLHDLAFIYSNKGKVEDAILLYEKSLKIFESIEDIQGQAATLYCLASIHADAGEIDYAIALYEKSLKIFESIRDDQQQAFALVSLGHLLAYEKGDFVTALDYLHQSLEIFQHIQSPDAETVRKIINDVQQMANG